MECATVKKSTDKYASCNFCLINGKELFEMSGRNLIVTICKGCIREAMQHSGHCAELLAAFRLYAHDEFGENVSDYMIQDFIKHTERKGKN